MSQTMLLQRQCKNKRIKRVHHPEISAVDLGRRFTNLPHDVVENIFSFLPLEKAVQNGVVSSRFQRSWVFNRRLIFDRAFASKVKTLAELVKTVNGVFEAHRGPMIQTFQLFFGHSDGGAEPTVHKWVQTAAEKGVEDLDLEFFLAGEPFNFPANFLDIPTLRRLKLTFCDVDFPRGLKLNGLRFLSTVVLRKVVLYDEIVEKLVAQCLGLESLDLVQCLGLRRMRIWASELKRFRVLRIGDCPDVVGISIDAPSLVEFCYHGHCRLLSFIGLVSKLDDVVLNFTPSRGFTQCYDTLELLASRHLRDVTVLTATSEFLEGLLGRTHVRYGLPRDYEPISTPWNQLKELQLFMEATTFCNLTDVASFLGVCTNLEKLFLDLNGFNFVSGIYWDLHQKRVLESIPTMFGSLKFIKIRGFKFQKHEIGLIRFLLQRSLVLEEMVLVFPENGRDHVGITPSNAAIYGRLFHSWKLSSNAVISLHEHLHDETHPINPKHSKTPIIDEGRFGLNAIVYY